ncbi:hypothetical protein G6F24_018781 [Rhizopus arrhizus]|nr:hypothetical protein G6F24_018781 [Rhizopus arrhizus]
MWGPGRQRPNAAASPSVADARALATRRRIWRRCSGRIAWWRVRRKWRASRPGRLCAAARGCVGRWCRARIPGCSRR